MLPPIEELDRQEKQEMRMDWLAKKAEHQKTHKNLPRHCPFMSMCDEYKDWHKYFMGRDNQKRTACWVVCPEIHEEFMPSSASIFGPEHYMHCKKFSELNFFLKDQVKQKQPGRLPISKKLRYAILKRDGFKCTYCGKKASDAVIHVDHKIPKSKGGSDELSNLVTACIDCNLGKGVTL